MVARTKLPFTLGPEVRFPPMDDPPPGQVMRISIDRIGGIGPWMP